MTVTPKGRAFQTRLRIGRDAAGKQLRERLLIHIDPESTGALERAREAERVMQVMANQLAAMKAEKAIETLIEAGKVAGEPKKLQALARAVDKASAVAGQMKAQKPKDAGPVTFREVVEEWTSGRLKSNHPDNPAVRAKTDRGRKIDRATLAVFLPALGDMAMAAITGEDILKAKKLVPADLDPDTRRLYLLRLRSVFRLARKPLKLITVVPDEAEDLPGLKTRNLFWFLYPEEEAQLLACRKIPLCYRVLYAWLMRNGTRIDETLRLTHDHLDLKRGRVHLEAEWTKTKRARFWDLEQDVHLAMRAWFEIDGRPKGERRVFHSTKGDTLHQVTVQERFLSDLLLAGVDRAELHKTTKGSRKLRVHDSRASFCTLARRRGMPDAWIMDRSGHESAAQLEKYSRFVRHADEQGIARWFADMGQAIPEIRAYLHEMGQGWATPKRESRKQAAPAPSMYSITESLTGSDQQETPVKPASVTTETPPHPTSGPAGFQGVGQPGPGQGEVVSRVQDTPGSPTLAQTDPVAAALAEVEASLSRAIQGATAAGEWETVRILARELEARRLAREAAAAKAQGVASLEAARRKRDEREGGK
jgi:integrase